jgi:trk system potassium uptake protein TrkA
MANIKRFVVLGLGSFGSALATRFTANGCRITGVDASEHRVDELKDQLYEAVVADVTDRDTLEQMLLQHADGVYISLGENIELSLLAALHAKELGARRVVVKGVTTEHGKILKRLGVDRVVFPEVEMAQELADRETWPNVLDFLPVDSDYSVIEIAVPTSIAGETLAEADLRKRYDILVLGVKDALTNRLEIMPTGDLRFNDDQLMLVLGHRNALAKFRELK